MIKLLHTADWHLDAPMTDPFVSQILREESRLLPEKIAAVCRAEGCQLLLIAGDLFDGPYKKETFYLVRDTLEALKIPVVITPGNHDHCQPGSPYLEEEWPNNVHIFKKAQIESICLPELDCRIYGAGYEAMDCPGLLKRFRAEGPERWHIGVFHADTAVGSPYFPITRHQLQESGLDYAALGHIHKQGGQPAGGTLCLWPGCPMGRGFDEPGEKGVLLVTLEQQADARFLPLDTPRFHDLRLDAGPDAQAALGSCLPMLPTQDIYRISFTGYSAGLDMAALRRAFPQVPHLILRDETLPEPALWDTVGGDSLEGLLFAQLQALSESDSPVLAERAVLAARICRSILDGQEVKLP